MKKLTNEEVLNLITAWQNKDPAATQLLMKIVYAKIKELSLQQFEHMPDDANTAFVCQSATDVAHDAQVRAHEWLRNLLETQKNADDSFEFIDTLKAQYPDAQFYGPIFDYQKQKPKIYKYQNSKQYK